MRNVFTAAVLNHVCDSFVLCVQMLGEECKHGLLVDHPLAHLVCLSGKTNRFINDLPQKLEKAATAQ